MKQRGFTLIELLLVIAIIGILAGVALPALIGQRERARTTATQELAKSVVAEIVHENNFGIAGATIINNISNNGGPNPVANFQYPAAKNAYGGAVTPIKNVAAAANGEVGMVLVVGGANAPDGTARDIINVTYGVKNPAGGTLIQTIPVPLD